MRTIIFVFLLACPAPAPGVRALVTTREHLDEFILAAGAENS